MNTAELLKVHHFTTSAGADGMQARLVKTAPYVRLYAGGGPAMYVKGGGIYSEGGQPMDDDKLPPWFWDEARKVDGRVREEVRLVLPEERTAEAAHVATVTPIAKPNAVAMWTCPERNCGKQMPTRNKGFHVSMHRRRKSVTVAGSV